MKPLTLEWVETAEEDWNIMLKGYRARKDPAYNAACFHAQQCAEKYLKGRLEEAGIAFRKTPDDRAFGPNEGDRTELVNTAK